MLPPFNELRLNLTTFIFKFNNLNKYNCTCIKKCMIFFKIMSYATFHKSLIATKAFFLREGIKAVPHLLLLLLPHVSYLCCLIYVCMLNSPKPITTESNLAKLNA